MRTIPNFRLIADPIGGQSFQHALDQMGVSLSAMGRGTFDISPDGTLVDGNTSFTPQQVDESLDNYFEAVTTETTGAQNAEQVINTYLELAAKQHPLVQKVITKLIYPLLVAIIAAYIAAAANMTLNINSPTIINEIQQEPAPGVSLEAINALNLRIVAAYLDL